MKNLQYIIVVVLAIICHNYEAKAQTTDSMQKIDTIYFGSKGCISLDNIRSFKIQRGTEIIVKLDQEVSSSTASEGDILEMTVYGNVVINGEVAFASNVRAIGEVSGLRLPKGFGRPAQLTISTLSVNAVNESSVEVYGIERSKKGKSKQIVSVLGLVAATVGTLAGVPVALFCSGLGVFEKGGHVTFEKGTMFRAQVLEDIIIKG